MFGYEDMPMGAFRRAGRKLTRFYKKDAPAPDYGPMAQASEEAARLGKELGEAQLAEARRQYDTSAEFLKPILDSQLQIQDQNLAQAKDYANYAKSFRPLEQQMAAEATLGTNLPNAAERDAIEAKAAADAQTLRERTEQFAADQKAGIDLATGGNQAIADRYAADINQDVGNAVANARQGQTQAVNTALRQAMRYGMTVPGSAIDQMNQNALGMATAANSARSGAIDNYRNIVAQGLGLKQNAFTTGQAATTDAMNMANQAAHAGRNMKIQDQSLDWARKLDVAGMARGMSGVSSGAYGMALNAGNSAAQNQMAPGQSLVNAMGQSNQTQMQGKGQQIQGLGSILDAQSRVAASQESDGIGSILGGIGGIAAAFKV